jgi:signal transduction histidine kinase
VNGGYLFSVRSARVVALGRAILAVFMLFSFLLGPYQNAAVDVLIAGNLVWSLALLAATQSRRLVYGLMRVAVPIAGVDLLIYTVLLYATSGADSPYFSPFIVLTLAATIQWGSRGAMALGLLTLLAFLPAGWQVGFGVDRDAQAAQSFILRIGYTGIITVLLAAFGGHVERVVQELSRLSDPFAEEPSDGGPPVRECLRHAMSVFRAERGMMLWEEDDEPYATLITFADKRFHEHRLPPGGEDWIAPDVAESVFLFDPQSGTTLVRRGRRTARGPARPLASELTSSLAFDRALVIPAGTRGINAWVVVLDHREPATEDLEVGAMVSAQVSVALERWESHRARRTALAAEDRIRLSRDLHDGVLQFLAGAGLQLDSLAGDARLADDVRSRIQQMRQSFSDEALELRSFITTLRPARGAAGPRPPLADELSQLAERLSRHWTIEVRADVAPAELRVPHEVSYDLSRIVREAVANAVRHGAAGKVTVTARGADERLSLVIQDDGRGFAFDGEVAAAQIDATGVAPRTLTERVRALDGRLELKSSQKGASVIIDVPLAKA